MAGRRMGRLCFLGECRQLGPEMLGGRVRWGGSHMQPEAQGDLASGPVRVAGGRGWLRAGLIDRAGGPTPRPWHRLTERLAQTVVRRGPQERLGLCIFCLLSICFLSLFFLLARRSKSLAWKI